MRPLTRLFLLALLSTAPLLAQAPVLPSADEVMSHAKAQAEAEHKKILLTFSASWCGPCRAFERFLEDPSIKPSIDKAFVIAKLDVGESPDDKRHADSPGGEALKTQLGGKNVGYPYILMLDASGKPIVTSLRPSKGSKTENIGYPALPVEVDWFMVMLQKSAPSLTPEETLKIRSWLTAHAHN